MCFEAYLFRKNPDDERFSVRATEALVCTLEDEMYECGACACAVYLRLESVDNKRRHFAHGPNTSCDGSFDANQSREANRSEERRDGRPGWFASLTSEICKPEACNVHISKSVVADVVGAGGRPIFVQRAPLTRKEIKFRNAEVAALGLPTAAWIMQSTITLFRDVSYGGDELKLAKVDCFDIGTNMGHMYVDGLGPRTLARVRDVGDGHVYTSRDGLIETVSVLDVLRDVFGEDALRVSLDVAAGVIARIQPLTGGCVASDFVDWRAWMTSARPDFSESHRLDAHKAWTQIHEQNGMRVRKKRAPKLLEGGVPPSPEQREKISSVFGSMRTLLEGSAGTGKTVVARAVANAMERMGFRVACTGSTNRASIALMGKTLHSFCGVQKPAWLSPRIIRENVERMSEATRNELRSYAAVILDEYAMLAPEYVSLLHAVLCFARGNQLPFGGCMVLMTGNVDQIPPVCTAYSPKFFFDKPATAADVLKFAREKKLNTWAKQAQKDLIKQLIEEAQRPENATTTPCVIDSFENFQILRQNHRQGADCSFQEILAELSSTGRLGASSRRVLAARVFEYNGESAESVIGALRVRGTCPIMAYTTDTVKSINEFLDGKKEDRFSFDVMLSLSFNKFSTKRKADHPDFVSKDEFERLRNEAECRAREWMDDIVADRNAEFMPSSERTRATYLFGKGSKVLLLERCDTLSKHTIGTLVGKNNDGSAVINVGNTEYTVQRATIEIPCNGTGSASITYTPLAHMAACTVHKSQGATITGEVCIVVDVSRHHWMNAGRPWPYNLGYTALTRCTRLIDVNLMVNMSQVVERRKKDGVMTIDTLIDQVFRIDPRVMEYKRKRGWVS